MKTTSSVFTNDSMKSEIHRINSIMSTLGAVTIKESLLYGTSMDKARALRIEPVKADLLQHLDANYQLDANGERESYWNKFGIYTHIEISNLNIRSNFLADLKRNHPKLYNWVDTPYYNLPNHVLREISLLAFQYPNITWSLKILALQRNDNTCLQPNTNPCKRATEFLFNNSFHDDQLGHTNLCHRISEEVGLSPLDVNTALWVIGQKLKE